MNFTQYFIQVVLLYVSIIVTSEPHCSRFHYEEKLLEKMIRMELRMEEMERKLEMIAADNGFITQEIKDLKSNNERSKVVFFAKAKPNQLSMSKNEIIVFDTVVTNIGDSYDPLYGKFVAPQSGTYVFFSTVLGHNNAMIFLTVAVNDKHIVNFYGHGLSGGHDGASVTVAVQLNKGDIVTIKNNNDPGNIHGNEYSSFGGFLL